MRLYWLAVVIRLCTEAYVGVLVVRDILRPAHDPVRRGGVDDPAGGVLDGAADVDWLRRPDGPGVPSLRGALTPLREGLSMTAVAVRVRSAPARALPAAPHRRR